MDGTKMTLNILQLTTLLCHQEISRPIDCSLSGKPTSISTYRHEHALYLFNSLVNVYYFTHRSKTNLHRCVYIFSFLTTFRVKLIFLICLLLFLKSNLYFAYKMSLLKFFVSTLIIIFTNTQTTSSFLKFNLKRTIPPKLPYFPLPEFFFVNLGIINECHWKFNHGPLPHCFPCSDVTLLHQAPVGIPYRLAVMLTIRTHGLSQESRDTIWVVIVDPSPGTN